MSSVERAESVGCAAAISDALIGGYFGGQISIDVVVLNGYWNSNTPFVVEQMSNVNVTVGGWSCSDDGGANEWGIGYDYSHL